MKFKPLLLLFTVFFAIVSCHNPWMEEILRPLFKDTENAYTGPPGSGTTADPWIVHNIETLLHVGKPSLDGSMYDNWTLDAHYLQVRNITLSANWEPIGSSTSGSFFTGSYDGGGCTISNLTINNTTSNYQGMFAYVSGGTVKNIRLVSCNISAGNYTGGIAGFIDAGTLAENCSVTGSISGTSNTGGLIGYNSATVKNCYSTVVVTGTNNYTGGLIGRNFDTIECCYTTGSVSGIQGVGGIAGYNDTSGTIENSYSSCSVTGEYAGGLVGLNSGSVKYCYTTGSIEGSNYIGGLVGYHTNIMEDCVALGSSISCTGTAFGRVASDGGGLMNNNYANQGMLVNGSTTINPPGAVNNKDGGGISAAEWNNASWWSGIVFFDTNVWDIAAGRLPKLK